MPKHRNEEVKALIDPATLLRESLYRVDVENGDTRTLRYVGWGVYPIRDGLEQRLTAWQEPYTGEVFFLTPEDIAGARLIGGAED
jgi:hypothetical protein